MGTLAGSKVKLEVPEKFDGTSQKLSNFLFQVKTYAEVLGVSDITEQVKLAIKFLTGQAFTWWRSVSQEIWAALGIRDWATFATKLAEQFRDLHYFLRMRHDQTKLKYTASVQAYNSAFRNIYMEIRNDMSEADALFTYINVLKEAVQTQVMLHDPTNLLHAMLLADGNDSTMWFASLQQGQGQPGRHLQPPHLP